MAVAVVVALLVLASNLPHVWGAVRTPEGYRFLGLVGPYGNDQAFYLGWGPQQARNGHVLFEDKFNGATDRRLVFNPLWLAMGWGARALDVSVLAAFHVQRVLFSAALLLAAYALIARFVAGRGWRLLALVLFGGGSGFGALLLPWDAWGSGVGHQPLLPDRVTPDLWVVESNVFFTMLGETVLPCATLLLILTLHAAYAWLYTASGSPRRAGLTYLLLGSVYPYALVSVGAIVAAAAALRIRQGRDAGRTLREGAGVLACGVPVLAWDAFLVLTDPRLTEGQALYASPEPWRYVLGFGSVGLLAIAGAACTWRRDDPAASFVLAWIGATATVMYVPRSLLPFQLQLVLGLQLPLAVLATRGGQSLWSAVPAPPRGSPARAALGASALAALVLSAGITSAYQVANAIARLRPPALPEYLPADLEEAIGWLARHADETSVVAASAEVSPYVPVLAHSRVYTGDYAAPTAGFASKRQRLEAALSAADADTLRRFLVTERIDYVLLDAELAAIGGGEVRERLDAAPALQRVFGNASVTIYALRGSPPTRPGAPTTSHDVSASATTEISAPRSRLRGA